MAGLQMPDFKQIDVLIDSYQKLDWEFANMITDTRERERRITRICNQILKDNCADLLADIPVSELRNAKAGIRVTALENAGYENLLDLYRAQSWQLKSIQGIGDKQAASINGILNGFLTKFAARSRIRLSVDEDDRRSRELIGEIARWRGCEQVRKDAEPLSAELHRFVEETTAAVLIRSRLRWFFSRKQTREETILAIGSFLSYNRSPQYRRISDLLTKYREAVNMSEADTLEDFRKNSASYYALIERLTGKGAPKESVYSSIPAQLAEEIDSFELDLSGFKGNLRGYQEFGARYILSLGKVLLGDEMGLGKTVQAIAAMAHLHAQNPSGHFLIVCPASVMVNWCREIAKFSNIRVNLIHGALMEDSLRSWQQGGGAAVTNYESMGKIIDEINDRMKLMMLVVDEAHYIKNPEAKRTRYIHSLREESERILMMTGTPLENRVDEMCELIGFVRPDMVQEVRANAGMRHVPQFKEILAPVYLRRQRSMVLDELPPMTVEEEWCEMTPEDAAAYAVEAIGRNFTGMRRVSFLQEDLSTSSKAIRLKELCAQARDEGIKVIVYSYFRDTIRKVIDCLGNDMVVGSITGSTPAASRQDLIDRFSDDSEGNVLVCQVQAGGTGLNIQTAGIVIFCEPQIKPSLTWQAISRVYRMGQIRNVLVYHLLCQNTVDESVREILAAKEEQFDLYAEESAIADAADGLADKEWIRQVVEKERQKYLPAVVES